MAAAPANIEAKEADIEVEQKKTVYDVSRRSELYKELMTHLVKDSKMSSFYQIHCAKDGELLRRILDSDIDIHKTFEDYDERYSFLYKGTVKVFEVNEGTYGFREWTNVVTILNPNSNNHDDYRKPRDPRLLGLAYKKKIGQSLEVDEADGK